MGATARLQAVAVAHRSVAAANLSARPSVVESAGRAFVDRMDIHWSERAIVQGFTIECIGVRAATVLVGSGIVSCVRAARADR
jgi:hypothetical protein